MHNGKKVCRKCGYSLPLSHEGSCPNCGAEGIDTSISSPDSLLLEDSKHVYIRGEFLKKNPKIQALIWILTVVALIIGYLFGVVGLIISVIISIIINWLGPRAAYLIIREQESS